RQTLDTQLQTRATNESTPHQNTVAGTQGEGDRRARSSGDCAGLRARLSAGRRARAGDGRRGRGRQFVSRLHGGHRRGAHRPFASAGGPGDRRAGEKIVFCTNSCTETIEAAIKLARYHTRRHHLIAFRGAFHGRSLGALSLTASRASHRAHFGPLLAGVHHLPYGGADCAAVLEKTLFRYEVPPDEIAAIFVEPIQGEGGYVVPP